MTARIYYKDDLQNIEAWNEDDKTVMIECSGIRPLIDIMRVISGTFDIVPGGENGKQGLNIKPDNLDPEKPVRIRIQVW